ncbi:MAG: hypothetical protein ACI93R_001976 [Flavobacteriales bacterium]|jgi:hypothetical protein
MILEKDKTMTIAIKRIITLMAITTLMSCSSVPLMTKLKLRNLDPLHSDPSGIRLAVVVDKVLTFESVSSKLTLGFDSGFEATSLMSTFEATIDSQTLEGLHSLPRRSTDAVTLFYLDAQNAAYASRPR